MPRDLIKDLELISKATPGPWVFDKYDVDIWSQPNLWRVANVRLYADMQFIAAAREGWPEAIERAIKAEAEVKKWQDVAEQRLENALVVAQKVCRLEAENIKLRAVVDAAKQFMNELDFRGKTHSLDMSNYHGRTIHIKQGESGKPYWLALWSLEQALAELDKAKEGQDG